MTFLILFIFTFSHPSFADEVQYKWTGPSDELCTKIKSNGETEQVDFKQCLLKAPVEYAWIDEEQLKCGIYTPNKIFKALADTENCKNKNKIDCVYRQETIDKELRTFIDGMLYKVIPEILSLKDGQKIPKNIIEEKNSKVIGASILARLNKLALKKMDNPESIAQENIYDFYKDSEIQMAFDEKYFDSIRQGCFKNQFQTNASGGALSKDERATTEKKLAGIEIEKSKSTLNDPSDKSHNIRPKYAYFVPTKPMENVYPHEYVPNYGNVIAVMRDEIKDRSTFTAFDSLGYGMQANIFDKKDDYKKMRYGKMLYWEAQIWGEVCLKDVSHFLVNCKLNSILGMKDSPETSTEAIKKMLETGIPVYECSKERRGVNSVYTKGSLVSEEDLK